MEILNNLEILRNDHEALLTKCEKVDNIKEEVIPYLDEMEKLCDQVKGMGLSANQVGLLKRFFIMKIGNKYEVFINPIVIRKSQDQVEYDERCLSYDEIIKKLRHKGMIIQWVDRSGKKQKKKFSGIRAICIQHELMHLNGISFKEDSNV